MQQQLLATPTQIPDDIARLAREQKLGEPQGNYTITKLARGWRWSGFIFWPVICIYLVGLVVFLNLNMDFVAQRASLLGFPIDFATARHISSYIIYINLLPAIFLSFGALVFGGNRVCSLYPCGGGFILKQSTKKFHTIRWNEIESVCCTFARTPKSLFTRYRVYKIRCRDGYTLTFDGPRKDLANLDKAIAKYFTRQRLSAYLANYEAGQPLKFGPLTLSLTGISVHDNVLPWEQVADIELLKGRRLVISSTSNQQSPWLSVQAFNVPNLIILLALVRRIRTGETAWETDVTPLAVEQAARPAIQTNEKHNLPEGIAALAAEHQLGERRTDEKLGLSRFASWSMIIVTLIMSALLLAFFNWIFTFWPTSSDISGGLRGLTIGYKIIISLLVGVHILASLVSQFRHIYCSTYTFEHGLILQHGRKAPVVCRWDEMEHVWRAAFFGKYPLYRPGYYTAYTIQCHGGPRYTLSSLDINLEAFGKIVREQITPLQLPATLAAYQAGQTLSFGPLRVSQEGIAQGTRLLPWSQVKSVALLENALAIYEISQRKPWHKLVAARVPDLYVLFALADSAREHTGSSEN